MIKTEDSAKNYDNDDYRLGPETLPLNFDKDEEFGKEGEDDTIDIPCSKIVAKK